MTPDEKKTHVLLQQLGTLGHEKEATRRTANAKRKVVHLKKQALIEARKAPRKKEELKALYRRLGKEEAKREFEAQGMSGRHSKKRKQG
jgi:hypothetical protein